MELFSMKELIIMASILGGILLIIMFLTILDFFDARKEKKMLKKEEKNKVINNEIKSKEESKKEEKVEEIEILDFDEPVIEMKEELANNMVIEEQVVEFNDNKDSCESTIEKMDNNIVLVDEKTRAKEELSRLEIELAKEEEFENTITNFELEQEENAIISYDELLKVSDTLYEKNEIVQYDDGDEPITIDEVIKRFANNDMVFENTANLDKLNHEIENNDKNLVEVYENK